MAGVASVEERDTRSMQVQTRYSSLHITVSSHVACVLECVRTRSALRVARMGTDPRFWPREAYQLQIALGLDFLKKPEKCVT